MAQICEAHPSNDIPATELAALPGILRDSVGKPVLPIAPEALYTFGQLIRQTEQFLLDLFSKGLLSGTTHTCIGQELCQMSVVRALNDPRVKDNLAKQGAEVVASSPDEYDQFNRAEIAKWIKVVAQAGISPE